MYVKKEKFSMEIQLQEMIEQIKKDGVIAAENEASAILEDAKAQAEKILADARLQAEQLLQNARNENEKMVRSGEDSIRQAGRNLLISFRESVNREIRALVSERVSAVYSSEAFAALLLRTVEAWAKNPEAESLCVLLSEGDLKDLEESVLGALKERAARGVTLKATDRFDGGFRIALNDDGVYYDYSADAVVQMLTNYLSPKVSKLLKEAN
jgi:V/A-type H+-transporting ATPase subunit E